MIYMKITKKVNGKQCLQMDYLRYKLLMQNKENDGKKMYFYIGI